MMAGLRGSGPLPVASVSRGPVEWLGWGPGSALGAQAPGPAIHMPALSFQVGQAAAEEAQGAEPPVPEEEAAPAGGHAGGAAPAEPGCGGDVYLQSYLNCKAVYKYN